MGKYYAKSPNQYHGWISNQEHSEKVSALAGQFGCEIGKAPEARVAGQFHDFGKNGTRFGDVLKGNRQNIDHAFSGASFLFMNRILGKEGTFLEKMGNLRWKLYEPIIESIMGHHDGLVSLNANAQALKDTYESSNADFCPSGKFPSLHGKEEFSQAIKAFLEDFPDFQFPKLTKRTIENKVDDMLDTRMLFSCLVDADYSVSASDDNPDYLLQNSRDLLDAASALNALKTRCAEIKSNSKADKNLNVIRDEVFDACGNAGELPPGLFTLTAPTGVGKTLAMIHFALRHCITNSMSRIIVVLPFLTLAEQTEKEYRHIFSDILVDHSQSNLPDNLRELAARWDAPIIITTSVRFFESLFANKPTDCRKLHNIANSVILFDESQSLPAELAPATIKAVHSLCKKYNCTMVFSTATQPDFSALPDTEWTPTEIIQNSRILFAQMRRVTIEWRFFQNGHFYNNQSSFAKIAWEMTEYSNVCAIVNLRRHAKTLFDEVKKLHGTEGLFLLTTDLCPAHRLKVVEEIKQRQISGEPCIVVATQCIEAGVDLDFDVLFRSLAPLEAIIQAAGRCNRNKRMEYGKVIVFEPDDDTLYPDTNYGSAASIVKSLLAKDPELDIYNPEIIREYYTRLFRNGYQNKTSNDNLEKAIDDKDYAKVSEKYKLIKDSGTKIIIPWVGMTDVFEKIKSMDFITSAILHEAAPITVNSFDTKYIMSIATPLKIGYPGHARESGYYILNTGFEDKYDSVTGLASADKTMASYTV